VILSYNQRENKTFEEGALAGGSDGHKMVVRDNHCVGKKKGKGTMF
jgi:hypothetical protein